MITLRNRNTRPSNVLWDPFFNAPNSNVRRPEQTIASRIQTNITKNENGFQIQLAAPGFSKDQFNLEIKDQKLIISLESKTPDADQIESQAEKPNKTLRKEFHFDVFQKSYVIPEGIDLEKIKASYEAGILSVDLVNKPVFVKTVKID